MSDTNQCPMCGEPPTPRQAGVLASCHHCGRPIQDGDRLVCGPCWHEAGREIIDFNAEIERLKRALEAHRAVKRLLHVLGPGGDLAEGESLQDVRQKARAGMKYLEAADKEKP